MNPSTHPTRCVVDRGRLAGNLSVLQEAVAPAAVMPVIKANAYGHGLVEAGRMFDELGVSRIAVAHVAEGCELRRAGIEVPVLVMGASLPDQLGEGLAAALELTVSSWEGLEAVERAAEVRGEPAGIHLKIDTGMGRLGVAVEDARAFVTRAWDSPWTRVMGLFSHLACADDPDLGSARGQVRLFSDLVDWAESHGMRPPVVHLANSAGALRLPESRFDAVRVGIALYGVSPTTALDLAGLTEGRLRPAMSWVSRVTHVKTQPTGRPVSYGWRWAPQAETRLATVAVGYADGYHRCSTGRAEVLIGGRRCPVVGTICMDQFVVDVGAEDVSVGDEVVLLGGDGSGAITAETMSEWAGTIPYEVLTSISSRVPRHWIQ